MYSSVDPERSNVSRLPQKILSSTTIFYIDNNQILYLIILSIVPKYTFWVSVLYLSIIFSGNLLHYIGNTNIIIFTAEMYDFNFTIIERQIL